ncbi:MAG: AAA family ATPase [Chloroflexi bacterium]|nr:AAA family ATPase [Chloroflexota bacterium]
MLKIRLLGVPLVELDNELLEINRRTPRALLFYLAMHKEPIGRDRLCDFIWADDGGEKDQKRKLRGVLNNLRNSFPDKEVIRTYHDMVGLVQHDLEVDVWKFNAAIKKMNHFKSITTEDKTLPPGLFQDLVSAAELWRGDTFIESSDMQQVSSETEKWWSEKNREFKKDRLALYKFVAQQVGGMGRDDQAVSWAEKALAIEEYDEEAHFLLLRSLLRSGQRKRGYQHYLSIKDDFEEAWGGDFVKDIHALGREFAQEKVASPIRVGPEWSTKGQAQVSFIGQEDAIQILLQRYSTGGTALVLGEIGAGKTRLVQEFYRSLELSPRVLFLPCHERTAHIPYQPLRDMLWQLTTVDIWKELPIEWIEPVMALMPKTDESRAELSETMGRSYAKSNVFEAVKNILWFFAQKEDVFLFVDDVHWADEATLSLLIFLLDELLFEEENIFLVMAADIDGKNSNLDKLLSHTITENLTTVEVLPLSEENISELAFYILQEKISKKAVGRLLEETGGNALFVLETLLDAWTRSKENKLSFDFPTPPSIKRLIEEKVAKLSENAREFLSLAAIQGNPFEISVLEKSVQFSSQELFSIIEELQETRFIARATEQESLSYSFLQTKVYEELNDSLPPIKSRSLHKVVAQTLESLHEAYPDPQASVIAEHYEKAEEFLKAFSWWIRAAKYAYQLYSIGDSVVAYQRAEALLSKVTFSENDIYALYAPWGIMLFESDNPDALEIVMKRFLLLGEKRGSNLLTGAALDGLSDVYMARNQFEEGLEYTKNALSYLETSENIQAKMSALIHHGVFLYMLNGFSPSQKSFQETLVLGEGRNDKASLYFLGNANYQMATVLTGMGFPMKAIEYAEKSLHLMRLAKSAYGTILPHTMSGLAYYFLGNYEKGREHALKGIEIASQTDSWRMLGYASVHASMNEVELASFGAAWAHAERAIALGNKYKHTEIESMGYKTRGDIYARLNALPQAAAAYQKGMEVDKGSFATLENMARLGLTLSLLGDPQGDALLQQAYSYTKAADLGSIFYTAKAIELSIFVLRKDYTSFEEKAPLIRKAMKERSHSTATLWVDYLDALADFQRGDLEEAQKELELLCSASAPTSFFWIRFRVLKAYIQILQKLGRESSAPRAELKEMLLIIEKGLGNAPLEAEWKTFATNI